MSWWVKEHIAVNEDETQQLCSIEADNQTSLPAADQSATAGFIIVRGSSALVLDTGDNYIMNSAGTWVQQPSGVQLDLSGYATTQDLTDGLASKITMEDCYGVGTQIPTNGTVDDTQLGRFYCANAATAATVTGAPWSDSGFFGYTERSISTTNRFIQIAFRNDDSFRIAKRRYIGTWQPWTYIDTYDEGNLIPDSANLNDYTRGGKYYGGNSAGASVSNLPVANSAFNFSLEVKNVTPIHTMQYITILRIADDPYIYKRRYYGGSWSSWYRFESVQV